MITARQVSHSDPSLCSGVHLLLRCRKCHLDDWCSPIATPEQGISLRLRRLLARPAAGQLRERGAAAVVDEAFDEAEDRPLDTSAAISFGQENSRCSGFGGSSSSISPQSRSKIFLPMIPAIRPRTMLIGAKIELHSLASSLVGHVGGLLVLRLVARLELDLPLGPRPPFLDLGAALALGVQLVAEEDRQVGDPEPDAAGRRARRGCRRSCRRSRSWRRRRRTAPRRSPRRRSRRAPPGVTQRKPRSFTFGVA